MRTGGTPILGNFHVSFRTFGDNDAIVIILVSSEKPEIPTLKPNWGRAQNDWIITDSRQTFWTYDGTSFFKE